MNNQVAGLLALGIVIPALFGFVKYLLKKPSFSADDRKKLTDLHDWHDVIDPASGLKRWYNTADQHETQKYLLKTLQELHYNQKSMTGNLVQLTKIIEKLYDKLDKS